MKTELDLLTQRGLKVPSTLAPVVVLSNLSHHADDTRGALSDRNWDYAKGSQDDLKELLEQFNLHTPPLLLSFARPWFKNIEAAVTFTQYVFSTADTMIIARKK